MNSNQEPDVHSPEVHSASSRRNDHETQNLLWTNTQSGPNTRNENDWTDSSPTLSLDSRTGSGNQTRVMKRKPVPTVETRYILEDIEPTPEHVKDMKKFKPLRLSWTFEIFAIILCLASLAAIIALLIHEDGKPLGNWNGVLSLNTVVSILGVVSRASLAFAISSCIGQGKWNWFRKHTDRVLAFRTFDDASRGPWGGAQLIWKLNIRHIATLGAITTIVMLGFDPFLQAVIAYEGQLDETALTGSTKPSLSSSTRLDSGGYHSTPGGSASQYPIWSPYNTTIQATFFASQPDLGMSAAVFNGFDNPSTSTKSNPSFSCSTGNCTYPLLTSLAVCSACNDISSLVVRNRTSGYPYEYKPSNVGIDMPFTQYILPGLTMSNQDGPLNQNIAILGVSSSTTTAVASSTHNDTVTFKDNLNLISSVLVMRAADSYINGFDSWQKTSITATECMLYYCTNLYQSSVNQGDFKQDAVHSWSNRNLDSYLPVYTSGMPTPSVNVSQAWNKQMNYDFIPTNGDLSRSDLELYIPEDEAATFTVPSTAALKFNVSQAAVASMVMWLQNDFFTTSKMVYGYNNTLIGEPVVESIGKSTNLTETFATAAESMSNWIRNSANTTQDGVLQQWVLHVRVRWYFMAVPCFAIAVGVVFVLFTIVQTRWLGLTPWKTDVLASMVYGFDDRLRSELGRAESEVGDMDLVGDELRIRLVDTEKVRHLRAQDRF